MQMPFTLSLSLSFQFEYNVMHALLLLAQTFAQKPPTSFEFRILPRH